MRSQVNAADVAARINDTVTKQPVDKPWWKAEDCKPSEQPQGLASMSISDTRKAL
ncbi:hypothetical protein [Rhizobium sp. SEMIA4064]|uniref:hypothetical protein n=1 Tax=Rhizobium sp. SEMIA4064 TaxID=2127048 RepID=UPI0015E7C4E0|nr:hypothetical protein [Rhizobium sp. SEMIA4064]